MWPSLIYRIVRASAPLPRLTGLIKQSYRYLRWEWLILGLAIIPVTSVLIIASTGTGFATSSSSLCLSCHGTGEAAYVAEEKIVNDADQCILTTKEMRDRHKDLLNDWKKSVVRQGDRIYVTSDGQEYTMSLTSTCLNCHSNKTEFCNRCHDYVAVKPNCWNCHNKPEDGQ